MIQTHRSLRDQQTILCASEEATLQAGAQLAKSLKCGDFVALQGEMGAGKTAFVRGLVGALGDAWVSSPTFTIVHEYPTCPPVFHFDCYRLQDACDLLDIGFEDYLQRPGIVVMEWSENVMEVLPKTLVTVRIRKLDEQTRQITVLYGTVACQ